MNSTDARSTASCLHNACAEPISLTDPEVLRFPYPTYARLRNEHPVYFSEEIRHWVVTRYDDVAAVLQDAARFPHCTAAEDFRDCLDPFIERPSLPMSFMGLTGHTPFNDALSGVSARETVHSLRPFVQEAVDFLLEPVLARREMDLVKDFACPLPALVMARLLGAPPADRDRIRQWSNAVAPTAGCDSQALKRRGESWLEATQYFRELVAARGRQPQDDLVTRLSAARRANDAPDDEEIATQCAMMIAGNETTQSLISSCVYSLCRFPEQFELLIENPDLIDNAIMEVLRLESPVQGLTRAAAADVELQGERISRGERVLALIGAANHDPRKFRHPERLDLERRKSRLLAFGQNSHGWADGTLWHLEARVALETILARMPHIATVSENGAWSTISITFRGLRCLPVVF